MVRPYIFVENDYLFIFLTTTHDVSTMAAVSEVKLCIDTNIHVRFCYLAVLGFCNWDRCVSRARWALRSKKQLIIKHARLQTSFKRFRGNPADNIAVMTVHICC